MKKLSCARFQGTRETRQGCQRTVAGASADREQEDAPQQIETSRAGDGAAEESEDDDLNIELDEPDAFDRDGSEVLDLTFFALKP